VAVAVVAPFQAAVVRRVVAAAADRATSPQQIFRKEKRRVTFVTRRFLSRRRNYARGSAGFQHRTAGEFSVNGAHDEEQSV
jgi:hypothetical protein